MSTSVEEVATLGAAQTVALTSFRRSGKAVVTPLNVGVEGDVLYIRTPGNSGKVKRIRNDGRVLLATCTRRGDLTGPNHAFLATIVSGEDGRIAKAAIERKHPVMHRWIVPLFYRFRRLEPTFIRLVPDPDGQARANQASGIVASKV